MIKIYKDINALKRECWGRRQPGESSGVGSFYRIKMPSLPAALQNRQALPAMKRGAAVSE